MGIGKIVRGRRKQMGMTLDQVAEQVGISKPYLSNIETGRAKNPPTNGVLTRLETALAFDHNELTRAADLARTPTQIRQAQEMLEAQLSKYHAALKDLLLAQRDGVSPEIQQVVQEIDSADDLLPFGAGSVAPVINTASSGYPAMTDLQHHRSVADEYVRFPDLHDPRAFAVRVVGDAMEPDFHEGEIVVFSPATTAAAGMDCFVRFADGRTTFRRMYKDELTCVRLQPLNCSHPAQVCSADGITGLWPAVAKFQRLTKA